MNIRAESTDDQSAVYEVNRAAFETTAEARLVDVLRKAVKQVISLVAEEDGNIVGHISFTPVSIADHPGLRVMGLAPVAVLPKYQRQGIGTALVQAGLAQCRKNGFGSVVVVGHEDFYPRFGFAPAKNAGLRCAYDVPEEVWMFVELEKGYLDGVTGEVRYHPAFDDL